MEIRLKEARESLTSPSRFKWTNRGAEIVETTEITGSDEAKEKGDKDIRKRERKENEQRICKGVFVVVN